MDRAYVNSGIPASKQEFNPVCGSVTTGSLTTGEIYTNSPFTLITTSPQVLTPAQVVGGIIAGSTGGPYTVTMPSADDFKTYFGKVQPDGFTFLCDVYRRAQIMTLNLGTGVTEYRGGASSIILAAAGSGPPIIIASQFSATMQFVVNGGAWVVYYSFGNG
jgi:hypothetical protein